MAGQKVKCPICEEKKDKIEMIRDGNKRYYCKGECWDKFLKDKEFREKENREWGELYEYLKELHGLKILGTGTIKRLQDLRAGSVYNSKLGKMVRKEKSGIEFNLILDAYKLAENSIKWCIVNKLNHANDARALNYCMSIMIDKLGEADRNRKRKIKQDELLNVKKENGVEKSKELVFSKQNSETFDFLD